MSTLGLWATLAYVIERKEPLGTWKHLLGKHFPVLKPFLTECRGQFAKNIMCPETGHTLTVRQIREQRCAYPDYGFEADANEVRQISDEDVQQWRIDTNELTKAVCKTLGIEERASMPSQIGLCKKDHKNRPVYGNFSPKQKDVIAAARGIDADGQNGCFLTLRSIPGLRELLKSKRITELALADAGLDCSPLNSLYDCGHVCAQTIGDMRVGELADHLDGRLDTLGREYADTIAENERLKGDLSKLLSGVAKNVAPEFFQWIFVVLGTGSVNAASQKLGIPNSTFSGKLKEYAGRGPVYKMLYDMVTVRRKLGLKSVERFNEMFAEHQPVEACQEENLLRDLLDGLQSLNGENWERVRNELINLIEEVIS